MTLVADQKIYYPGFKFFSFRGNDNKRCPLIEPIDLDEKTRRFFCPFI